MNSFALWHEAADTLKEWFSHCLSNLPKAFVYILNHETSNIPKFPANEKEIATCVLLFWFLFLQDMMWILNSSRITGAGSKAKSMPCGHLFHDDCLISWVGEPNLEKKTCRGPDSSSCFFYVWYWCQIEDTGVSDLIIPSQKGGWRYLMWSLLCFSNSHLRAEFPCSVHASVDTDGFGNKRGSKWASVHCSRLVCLFVCLFDCLFVCLFVCWSWSSSTVFLSNHVNNL